MSHSRSNNHAETTYHLLDSLALTLGLLFRAASMKVLRPENGIIMAIPIR